MDLISVTTWVGSAEQIQSLRQWARGYDWEVEIEDPEYAAEEVLSALGAEIALHPDAESRLRAALVESAEQVEARVC